MTITPLTRWKCNACGELVSAENGYVVWDDVNGPFNFRIVHQGKCDNRTQAFSAPLGDFLGADGMAKLTSMISYGPAHRGKGRPHTLPDPDQYVDFFRRVQLPFYEEARERLNDPEVQEDFADANEVWPYLQEVLVRLTNETDE